VLGSVFGVDYSIHLRTRVDDFSSDLRLAPDTDSMIIWQFLQELLLGKGFCNMINLFSRLISQSELATKHSLETQRTSGNSQHPH